MTLVMSSFKTSHKVDEYSIVGKWSGLDENNENGTFVFDADGYATMIKNGQSMGGKEFEMKGIKASMKYKIDKSSNPIKFDIIVLALKSKEVKSMKMLLKFIDNNTIKLASDFNETRPLSFTKANSILLKRE